MRILVTGSRTWRDSDAIRRALLAHAPNGAEETTVVVGDAYGADKLAYDEALALYMVVTVYAADWARYGTAAGPIRNRAMLDTDPDVALAFWDGKSRGTLDCIREARRRGVPVDVHRSHGRTALTTG